MNIAISLAAVELARAITKSEYAVRITQLTRLVSMPVGFRGAATLENHGFYYSFWFDFSGQAVLIRIEGLGIFQAEWDDEEPPVVANVAYQLPEAEALAQAA